VETSLVEIFTTLSADILLVVIHTTPSADIYIGQELEVISLTPILVAM
jgi:hypothetical protein